jgi:N-acetylmuramoyl-L-alanine amidase
MFNSIAGTKKIVIFAISLIAFCCQETTTFSQSVVTQTGVTRVVVDAGHGGLESGAIGAISREKNINLAIALLVGQFIKDSCPGVDVIYTRTTDVFVPLDQRSAIANKSGADLFISIHTNSVLDRNKQATGTETFVMGLNKTGSNMEVAMRENSVITYEEDYTSKYEGYDPKSPESYIIFSLLQNAYLEQSLQMAARIQEEFGSYPIKNNRGVKQDGFLVLWRTAMPSVLIEIGFITNPQEEKLLNSKKGQFDIAHAIFRAFKSYKDYYEKDKQLIAHKPSTEEIKSDPKDTEFKKPASPATNTSTTKSKENEIQKNRHYRIQIKASSNKLPVNAPEFADYDDIVCIPFNTIFKYTVGNFTTFEDASKYCNDVVRKKVADAFVICLENGKIVPMKK